jgi:hypothetical protein
MLKILETKQQSPSMSPTKVRTSSESSQKTVTITKQFEDAEEDGFSFPPRIQLDIKVDAPLILVPENLVSKNALLLDCGVLTIKTNLNILKNYYHSKDVAIDKRRLNDRCQLPPIIEIQKLTLSKMEISK